MKLTHEQTKLILEVCDKRKFFIHEHDEESFRECTTPIVFQDYKTHFVMDNEGTVFFHGDPLMIYNYLKGKG